MALSGKVTGREARYSESAKTGLVGETARRKSPLPFAASGLSHSADNETEKATTQQKHGAGLRRLRQGHRGGRSIVDEADRA